MQDAFAAYRRRIRPIYIGALVLMVIVGATAVQGMSEMFVEMGRATGVAPAVMRQHAVSTAIGMSPLVLIPLWLVWRPVFWAKYLLLFPAAAWIMHGVLGLLMGPVTDDFWGPHYVWTALLCGVAMAALAITHFVLDRRQPPPRRPLAPSGVKNAV